ncbi:restriction endonuclease subunit S [Variovorax defluvii]|uniref:Restriction endonuclease subunit S n=1 Tax=Variovorax defluvii TaxID=913761 RepID=A0ABP8I7W3_9BURK
MKLETFFEKFDLFADAPDAVEKMRELVLHLAVHGSLVSQSDDDEPAAELLQSSRLAMAKMMETGKAKKEKPATPVTADEATFALPRGWAWCRLVDAGQFINGLAFKPSDWGNEGRPIIRIQNLSGRNLDYNRTTGTFDSSVLVQDGDILVSWSATLDAFIWRGEEGVLNQHIFRVLPAPLADKAFLFWLMKWVIRQLAESDHAHGLVMSHINRGPFLAHPIPLPPLAEQKRIAAKADELMALCDRLEAQQQELETQRAALARGSLARFAEAASTANLGWIFHASFSIPPSDLRKSILALAVQGKLVPQDPNDEPADELMKRSLGERRQLKRTDATQVQPIPTEDGLGYDIPESWRWQRLDDILVFGPTNGYSPKAVDYETPVRSLTLSATTSGRFKSEHYKFIEAEVPANSELWLRDGDILVQRGNTIEYVGVAAIYRGQSNCFIYPDLMMKLRVSAAFDVRFIHLAMSHEAARDFLRARASGTSGSMPKINQTTLRSLPLPIPPLAEQRRIVSKVDELMALVDKLENQLANARSTGASVLAAAVAELTNGNEIHAAAEV